MSILDTVSQAAATDPIVGVAVAGGNTKKAILASLQTGDPGLGSALGAAGQQAVTANRLLASLTKLGQNVDLRA